MKPPIQQAEHGGVSDMGSWFGAAKDEQGVSLSSHHYAPDANGGANVALTAFPFHGDGGGGFERLYTGGCFGGPISIPPESVHHDAAPPNALGPMSLQ